MSNMRHMPFNEFIQILGSKQSTPGGGSATAMNAALGMALANMVGQLTLGKKKYAAHETEIKQLVHQGDKITETLLGLVDKDVAVFKTLVNAYGLSQDTPKQAEFRQHTIEKSAKDACTVPLIVMQNAYEGLVIHQRMSHIGTTVAISDIGCGVAFLKASMAAARFNVLINLRSIVDKSYISEKRHIVDDLLEKGNKLADEILAHIDQKLT